MEKMKCYYISYRDWSWLLINDVIDAGNWNILVPVGKYIQDILLVAASETKYWLLFVNADNNCLEKQASKGDSPCFVGIRILIKVERDTTDLVWR